MPTPTLTTTTVLRSDELNCPSCVNKLEQHLTALDGVTAARVRFASGRIEVDHDPARAPVADLLATVRDAGYHATAGAF